MQRKAQLVQIIDKASLTTREHVVFFASSRRVRGANDAPPCPREPRAPSKPLGKLGELLIAAGVCQ